MRTSAGDSVRTPTIALFGVTPPMIGGSLIRSEGSVDGPIGCDEGGEVGWLDGDWLGVREGEGVG